MALIKAIEDGLISYAEKLLDEGADPNQINEYGESALMLAAQQDMPLIVKRLLIKGANPNAIDNLGNTALMLFINSTKNNVNTLNINSFEDSFIDTTSTIFKYLLKVSDLTIIKKNGDNPLLIAINSRKWIMAYNLVKIYNKKDILSNQLRVNAISTLITSYRSDEQFTSYIDVRGELIKMLINGFNDDSLNIPDEGINTPDSSGFNLLTLSIVYSVFFISELLVKKGILVSDEAINILKGAIKEYNTSNNNNSNSNSNNNNDNNNKNKNKNNNKNVNKKTNELAEEIKLLSLMLRTKELQNIYSKNNNTSESIALYKAVAIDNYDLTSSLIKDGINPNEQNRLGNTPLYVASYKGNNKIVTLLLDTPKIDVNKANNTGKTPLMVASLKNHLDIVNKLLAADGIKINNQDDEGFTALHYAAMAGNIGIIKVLIAKGADKSIKNKEDYMPFRYSKDFETKKLLALPFTDFSSVNHIIYNLDAIKNYNTSNISNKTLIGKNNSESYKKQIYKYLDKKDLCEGINPDYVKSALNNCDSFIVLMKDDEIFGICLIYIKTINEKDVLYIDVICTNLQYIGVGRYLINLVKSMIRKSKMKDIVLCSVSSAIEFYKKMNFVGNNSIKECGSVLKPMRYTLKGGRRRLKTQKRRQQQGRV